MSTPTPDALKALQARHHRIATDHMIASDHLAGFLREVSAEKVGTKALREKIAALGITPENIGEIDNAKLEQLAEASKIGSFSTFPRLREDLAVLKQTNEQFSPESLAELRKQGLKIPDDIRKTVFADVKGHLESARSQLAQIDEQLKAAQAKAAGKRALNLAEAEDAARQALKDYVLSFNKLDSLDPALKKALGQIRHRDHSLFAEATGATYSEKTFTDIRTVFVEHGSPAQVAKVDALVEGIKTAKAHTPPEVTELENLERAAKELYEKLRADFPHLDNHALRVEEGVGKTAKHSGGLLAAVEDAAKAGENAAKKGGGKTKWIIGGIGAAAVGLGAIIAYSRSKSHAREEELRRAQAAAAGLSV